MQKSSFFASSSHYSYQGNILSPSPIGEKVQNLEGMYHQIYIDSILSPFA